jgi:hypothetical protein
MGSLDHIRAIRNSKRRGRDKEKETEQPHGAANRIGWNHRTSVILEDWGRGGDCNSVGEKIVIGFCGRVLIVLFRAGGSTNLRQVMRYMLAILSGPFSICALDAQKTKMASAPFPH